MRYTLAPTSAANIAPVSIAEAQAHLRLDSDCDAQQVKALLAAATEHAQTFTSRQFVRAEYRLAMESFPRGVDAIELPRPPLIEVDNIKYVDTEGDEQTLDVADYIVDTDREPGRIVPAYGKAWPNARRQPGAVKVEYAAGYGAASDVPEGIKAAIKLYVGTWWEHRETIVTGTIATKLPDTAEALLWGYRLLEAV